jgi:hypothetical protein
MVLKDGLQQVLGAFDCVLGGQATKSTVIVRPKDLICINFELGGQISWEIGLHQSWVILAVFWVARPQNPLSMGGQKTFFVLILDKSDICLPSNLFLVQKLSSIGKSGTCALLEIL